MKANDHIKLKSHSIIIACLLVSCVLLGLSVKETLSLFTDRTVYTLVAYPYEGQGEASLTFSDGSVIKGVTPGETIQLIYSYHNTSIAAVLDMTASATFPDGSTAEQHLRNIPAGGTRSVTFSKVLSESALAPQVTEDQEAQEPISDPYRSITVSAIVHQFKSTGDVNTASGGQIYEADQPPLVSAAYVFQSGGSS